MDDDHDRVSFLLYTRKLFPKGCAFFGEDGGLDARGHFVAMALLARGDSEVSPCYGCNTTCTARHGDPSDWEAAQEQIVELCGGNPGALHVCIELYGTFGEQVLSRLVEAKIKGPDIWVLYGDVCSRDVMAMDIALRKETAIPKLQQNISSSFYKSPGQINDQ